MGRRSLILLCAILTACTPKHFNVREYGAVGDGLTKDTQAIQTAIDAAAAHGGGVVEFPSGTYLSGYIILKSNVSLYLHEQAVLKASPDSADYSSPDICPQNHAVVNDNSYGGHFLLCIEQQNVSIEGRGTIDGNSPAFTYTPDGQAYTAKKLLPWRPGQMIYIVESKNVTLKDVRLVDSPYWNLYLYGCTDVCVSGLDISSRRMPVSWNGDGIDVDCCRNVSITSCRINTNDDCIAIRADRRWLKNPQDCRNLKIENCDLSSLTSAIRFGVGDGAISSASVRNIHIHNTRSAFSFTSGWSKKTRGVDISDIEISDVNVDSTVILLQMYPKVAQPDVKTHNIRFCGINAHVELAGQLYGHAQAPYDNLVFSDVRSNMPIDTAFVRNITVFGGNVVFADLSEEEKDILEENYQKRKSEVKIKGI